MFLKYEKLKKGFFLILLFVSPVFIYAAGNQSSINNSYISKTINVIIGLGLIFIIANLIELLFKKINYPSIIAQIITGAIIGPYLLGSIELPGFTNGIFPLFSNQSMQISPELFILAIISAVIILFKYGLENDTSALPKLPNSAFIISLLSTFLSFALSVSFTVIYHHKSLFDPQSLLLGIIVSSVSLTTTTWIIFSRKSKAVSERQTIISSIILSNIIIIILFTILMIFSTIKRNNDPLFLSSSGINYFSTIESLSVWIVFFVLILLLAKGLNHQIKKIRNWRTVAFIILGICLFFSGLFELTGVTIIFSAFILGLIIAKTNINYMIRERLRVLYYLFYPPFLMIAGMLIDYRQFLSLNTVIFTLILVILVTAAKFLGGYLPTIFTYRQKGACCIGLGMIPQGELLVIMGFTAYTLGYIDNQVYAILILMLIITNLTIHPALNSLFSRLNISTAKKQKQPELTEISFEFETIEIAQLSVHKLLENLKEHGFYINLIEVNKKIFFIKNDNLFIIMNFSKPIVTFETLPDDMPLVKTFVYEILLDLSKDVNKITDLNEKPVIQTKLDKTPEIKEKTRVNLLDIFDVNSIILNLKATTKNDIIEEMVNVLYNNGHIKNKELVIQSIQEREKVISTGMQKGIAIPHCKTSGVDKIMMAIGIKADGINFDALDGKPSQIFVMLITPEGKFGPHIQVLMQVSTILNQEKLREKILNSNNSREIWELFVNYEFN